MTGHVFASLSCDTCGKLFDDRKWLTIPHVRMAARVQGWKRPTRSLDRCPRCSRRYPKPVVVKLSTPERVALADIIDGDDASSVSANTTNSLERKGYIRRVEPGVKSFVSTSSGRARYESEAKNVRKANTNEPFQGD